jgi:Domain of unknown function (DUF5615)
VLYIAELDPGIDDDTVLAKSRESRAVLLTADKDFGELVFRQHLLHSGVVLSLSSLFAPVQVARVTPHADPISNFRSQMARRLNRYGFSEFSLKWRIARATPKLSSASKGQARMNDP